MVEHRNQVFGKRNFYRSDEKHLTVEKLKKVMEDLEIKNLPLNHSLVERDKIYMESTYNLNDYLEVPMCVVILSHNNLEN